MPRSFRIFGQTGDDRFVDDDSPCYVVAEIGHNHGGCPFTCLEMVVAASEAGCSAVKLQKRNNKFLYSDEFYKSQYNSTHSYGWTYGEHREALEFDMEQYTLVRDRAHALGMDFAATAFDIPSVHFLDLLGVDWIKVASGDLTTTDLLVEIATTGCPVIFSTGGADSLNPIRKAHDTLRLYGSDVAVLHCTSGYPAEWDELNLRCIESLREEFPETTVGWSSHARGISQACTAYALGARIIEAHFTLDRTRKGTDQAFSLEPEGMATMVRYLRYCREALGSSTRSRLATETDALKKQWKDENGKITGTQRGPHEQTFPCHKGSLAPYARTWSNT